MEITEMDKHAHKMIVAYVLGKYEEKRGHEIDWDRIIKNGIYELLRRIVISDIKSPIYSRITRDKEVFRKLNEYVYSVLESKIENEEISNELKEYLFTDIDDEDLTDKCLNAAHIYASYWEFQIIKNSNPNNYQNTRIEKELLNRIEKYKDLDGVYRLINRHTISNFVDLFGQLRFQVRWAQTPRIPSTSVLGHTMLVAAISYFFARENKACFKRLYNDFFGGLFHDLAEAVTRDIISPLKKSVTEFDIFLKDIERQLAEEEIFPLLEEEWIEEIKYFTQDEFSNKVFVEGDILKSKITVDIINDNYNSDVFNPYDGELIRGADHLAAFLEAYNSINAGIKSEDLTKAARNIKDSYLSKKLGRVPVKVLYESFKL